jgi:hypothetical protein
MLVIAGLIVWLVAGIVAIVAVPSNAGAAHPPTKKFRVRILPDGVDRHVVPLEDHGRRGGAAGTERVIGARAASRKARRAAARFHREMAFTDRVRDSRLEHQQRSDSAAVVRRTMS